MIPSPEFTKWVSSQLSDVTSQGGIARVEVIHTVEGDHHERLFNLEITEDHSVDDVAADMWASARADADSRAGQGPQRYAMCAYREKSTEPDGSFPVVLKPSGAYLRGNSTDPPTEKGMMGQHMRMVESMHRQSILYSEAVAGRLAKELERRDNEREQMQELAIKNMGTMQELLDQKQERDLRVDREKRSAERQDQLMKVALSLLPVMAAKFLPPSAVKALPGAGDASRDVAIGKFLGSLDSTEIDKILEALAPEKKLALVTLYQSYAEEAKEAEAAKPAEEPQTEGH